MHGTRTRPINYGRTWKMLLKIHLCWVWLLLVLVLLMVLVPLLILLGIQMLLLLWPSHRPSHRPSHPPQRMVRPFQPPPSPLFLQYPCPQAMNRSRMQRLCCTTKVRMTIGLNDATQNKMHEWPNVRQWFPRTVTYPLIRAKQVIIFDVGCFPWCFPWCFPDPFPFFFSFLHWLH